MAERFDDARHFWARTLGLAGPQWMILVALAQLDEGDGVEIGVVHDKLQVNPSFVTMQSRVLERKGFLRREESSLGDAGIVRIALTDKAREVLAQFSSLRPNPPS